MFRFANPEYLNALWAIPVLIAFFWYMTINRQKLLEKFADRRLHKIIISSFSGYKNVFKFGLIILAHSLLVVAAANPQVGTKMTEVKQKGIDVFILLDVSYSMMAEDIKPNRLDKAKFQISSLIQKLRGDRIGLIIFAGQAYVQFPLTTDYSAANLFLSAVNENSVPHQGTAIAAAIDMAVKSFDTLQTEKVIVIISDGEDHEGDINTAVKNAQAKGIKIYTIGLGSPEGSPIPVYDNRGRMMGFKKDRGGNTVLTKLDEQTLKQIASDGNGKYFRGTNYDDYLDRIYKELSELEQTEYGVRKVTDYEDRFYYFLFPAIILLIVEFFISDRRSQFFTRLSKNLGLEQKL